MMRFALERVTGPDIEPVSATDFVRNVGEFSEAATDRADDIARVLAAAREWAEHETGRVLIDQTWRLTLTDGQEAADSVSRPGYYCGAWRAATGEILLRRSPALSIVSFKSVDGAGAETDVDAATYELREIDTKWPKLVGVNGGGWTSGTYRITFRAGYADRDISPQEDGDVVPAVFAQAILLYAQSLYDSTEKEAAQLQETATNLLRYERCNLDFA